MSHPFQTASDVRKEAEAVAAKKFKTIGYVEKSELRNYGLVFRIRLKDGSGTVLPYACAIMSEQEVGRQFGNARLAQLCQAVGVTTMRDTEELHNIDMIVTHDGTGVAKLEPTKVIVYSERIIRPISFWSRFMYRLTRSNSEGE
jgi:hypothetical protein